MPFHQMRPLVESCCRRTGIVASLNVVGVSLTHFSFQALNRIHRIGQTQPVTVYKLVVKDTVEQRILKLQAKKAALAEGALSMSKQKLSEMRLEDLKMLFSSYC